MAMKNNLVGGIDIGSSSIKWAVCDTRSKCVVSSGRTRYTKEILSQESVDIGTIFKFFKREFDKLLKENVSSAALSCMAPILVAVDSNFDPVLSLPYNSLVGSEFFSSLKGFSFRRHNLNFPNVQMFPQKILWLRTNREKEMGEVRHIVDLNGYLFNRMIDKPSVSGIPFQDLPTAAEWGMVDVPSRRWWTRLTDRVGITGMLPELVIPEFSSSASGVDLCIGTVDTMVSSLGSIGLRHDSLFVSNGSTLCAGFVSDRPVVSKGLYCDVYFAGRYLINGCNSQFSTILDFAKKSFGLDIDVDKVDETPVGVIFLPYLAGERCPLFNTDIRGGFYGFDTDTDKGTIVKSITHSLAYLSADMINTLTSISEGDIGDITAGGGLSKDLIARIVSSLTGIDYSITDYEPAVLGAAIISMRSSGILKEYPSDPSDLFSLTKRVIHPVKELRNHSEVYSLFMKVRNRLSHIPPSSGRR